MTPKAADGKDQKRAQDGDNDVEVDGFWYKQDKIALFICTECGAMMSENSSECSVCGAVYEEEEPGDEVEVDLSEYECYRDFLEDDRICQKCDIRVQCRQATEDMDLIRDQVDDDRWMEVSKYRCIGTFSKRDQGCNKCDVVIKEFCTDVVARIEREKEFLARDPTEHEIETSPLQRVKKWSAKHGLDTSGSDLDIRQRLMDKLYPDWEGDKGQVEPGVEAGEEPDTAVASIFEGDASGELQTLYDELMEFMKREKPHAKNKKAAKGVRTYRDIGYQYILDCIDYVMSAGPDYDRRAALEDAITSGIISQLSGLQKQQYQSIAAKAKEVFGKESRVAARLEAIID